MQNNISLMLTNDQISPGTWYFGLFNGIGPIRTQSKMINRGPTCSFSGNISVEGCPTSTMLGKFCNQTVDMLLCTESYSLIESVPVNNSYGKPAKTVVSCRNANEIACHEDHGLRVYSLDVIGIAEQLIITASNISFNQTRPSNGTGRSVLMYYARHGAMPLETLHDFSGDISIGPLVINSPKIGRWYIAIQPVVVSNNSTGNQNISSKVCYLLEWQVIQCPMDKAGFNCTSERYMLRTVLRKNPSLPFESYYLPITGKVSPDSANFPLEPLLSNFSSGGNNGDAWTFFLLDIPSGAAGGNVHIRLNSDANINYEIYAKYGGFPSLNSWDYYYTNSTTNSNGSMFFKLYDSDPDGISLYILYARGGTWGFGLRQIRFNSTSQTTMSMSLERCPQKCSSHGSCQSVLDASGLTLYSYCNCDRNHGGFDCGIELVSHRGKMLKTHVGHIRQSIFLIASNAAAVLPAYLALRQKAFAEWVIFTCSGISSGLYHACDVGTWCALSFHVLQFLDFWLSFMAVVSTFVYLATISEASKRTIHTVVAILTALMAETGPTRPSNIVIVMAIGALGLLIGLLIELCARYRSFSISTEFHLNLLDRWETLKRWTHRLIKTLVKRFRWGFILAGFMALAMAAISWKLESTESYWIWHSLWHVSIYTSSFLFICGKAKPASCEAERSPDGNYELTRQNSYREGEQSGER
ncbi:uncharacterized protein LOC111389941 isoform X3 [Olea europaea var. sylvestris]|nr:uncharacterized protein LOC111389941 isoform X3 [Olea europaea var. sylvestris]